MKSDLFGAEDYQEESAEEQSEGELWYLEDAVEEHYEFGQ